MENGHLGDTTGRFPTDQGFDEWYGIPNTTDESLYSSGFQYDESEVTPPFIIRWPAQIEAGRVHNEIMHITDLLPTLAHAAGASVPSDRIIDGVDQFEFLTDAGEHSARGGFPVYNGDALMAYKWGNWKLHFIEQASMGSMIERPGMPRLYNLLRDPKEQFDLIHYGGEDGFWVMPAIMKRVVAHQATLQKEPPIPLGTPDPYVPPGESP